MCPLRRVEDHRAGPSALGILVPPGRRTFLIVRPRSLPWDLLLLRPDSTTAFHELYREQAGRIAETFYEALQDWPESATDGVETIDCPDEGGFRVHVRVGPFPLVVCGRQVGQPYQALIFPDAEAAQAASRQLHGILHPQNGFYQEVYLNKVHFTR